MSKPQARCVLATVGRDHDHRNRYSSSPLALVEELVPCMCHVLRLLPNERLS